MLPSLPDPYPWLLVTVIVLVAFVIAFAYRNIKGRIVAPRLLFSDLIVECVPHGKERPDGSIDFTQGLKEYHCSVTVRNQPASAHGSDLIDAWTRLVIFNKSSYSEIMVIEGCRWEHNEKPRIDYAGTEKKRRFRNEWTKASLAANGQAYIINFGLKTVHSPFFYGFRAQDQECENFDTPPYSDWINENHKVPFNDFFCYLEVMGKPLHPLRYYMHVETNMDDLTAAPKITPVSKTVCKIVLEFREGRYS